MNLLAEILSSGGRAEIFRILFGLGPQELHAREIQRRSGLAMGGIQQELRKLRRLDLLAERRDGNRLYYRANDGHPLYPEIRGLVLKTSGLVDVLGKALGEDGIDIALVFGSIARHEEKAESDIDLMVIGQLGLRALSARISHVSEQLGREVNPHAYSRAEFVRRRKTKDHFLANVLDSPKLFIVGNEHDLAAMADERLAEETSDKSSGNSKSPRHR